MRELTHRQIAQIAMDVDVLGVLELRCLRRTLQKYYDCETQRFLLPKIEARLKILNGREKGKRNDN